VVTGNLDGFTLQAPASPVGQCRWLQVYADGIPAYGGEMSAVRLEAVRDWEDVLVGWESYPTEEASAQATAVARGFTKSPDICGPVGHAFLKPYVVCYGNAGSEADTRRHREEAEAFCSGWNGFVVHGPGLSARPEDELTAADLDNNLVIYGTLETSRLLQRAHGLYPFPVEVHREGVIVRDTLTGVRDYRGRKFGAFLVYPNPMSAGRTYIVVCSGRFATKSDGSDRQGLEFDLEKLSWGYSDYVIFNTDLGDLPHVMNVNNKPPVTCYEAGYFVEAGYFDRNWRLDRSITVGRVKRQAPERSRLAHVADVRVQLTDRSLPQFDKVDGEPVDPPRSPLASPMLCATVRVVDAKGDPVRQARVTGLWRGVEGDAISRPTLSDGTAYFPCPADRPTWQSPRFTVLNVMATGAAYDYEADVLDGSLFCAPDAPLAVRPAPLLHRVDQELGANVGVDVANLSVEPRMVAARLVTPGGEVAGAGSPTSLAPGQTARLSLRWLPSPLLPGGRYELPVEVWGGGASVTRVVRVDVPPPRQLPLLVGTVAGKDITAGEQYEVSATLRNTDPHREMVAALQCTIIEARRHLPTIEVRIAPGSTEKLVWRPSSGETPLPKGEYTVRVSVLRISGVSGIGGFAVR